MRDDVGGRGFNMNVILVMEGTRTSELYSHPMFTLFFKNRNRFFSQLNECSVNNLCDEARKAKQEHQKQKHLKNMTPKRQ